MVANSDPIFFIGYGLFALFVLWLIALWDARIAASMGLLLIVGAILVWGSARYA